MKQTRQRIMSTCVRKVQIAKWRIYTAYRADINLKYDFALLYDIVSLPDIMFNQYC